MRKFLIAASVLAFGAMPTLAADDVMAGFFGNTVVSSGGGMEFHWHYRADHSFDMVGSLMGMSKTFRGTWAVDGKGLLCRTYTGDALGDHNPECVPVLARKVGDTWTGGSSSNPRTLTLKAGVH